VTSDGSRDTLAPMKFAFVLLASLLTACSSKPSGRTVRVAAASDLAKAFEEVGKEFHAKTGITPLFDFGSSGLLAKQIEQGAPYFLFAAANAEFAQKTVAAGRCDGTTARMYARGRIVVWTPSGVDAPKRLEDLAEPRFKRIAIANPDHAPYGKAAKQTLEKAGVWAAIEDRIKLGPDVQTTMLYARKSEVEAAIVALSLAVVTDGGTSLKIDPASHEALDQQMVVCGAGEESDAARQLADFIGSREGREIMTRYGFLLPGEAMPGATK
jgi:molybdate transport system substrate-binding protein